jgi:hypothetical protein
MRIILMKISSLCSKELDCKRHLKRIPEFKPLNLILKKMQSSSKFNAKKKLMIKG